MVTYIIVDVIIVVLLIFFAWRSAQKGLILSLLGMLGLVVALFGARFISNTFYDPVSDIIEPGIYQSVKELEERALYGLEFDLEATLDSSAENLVDLLQEQNLFPGLVDFLENAVENDLFSEQTSTPAVEALSAYLAQLLSRVLLFVLSFIVILLVWFLITRALDLAFKLPILHAINTAGGAVFGFLKAAVIIIILVWVGQLLTWIPAKPSTPVLSLFTLQGIKDILNHLVI